MKIVFLDIDGVLATADSIDRGYHFMVGEEDSYGFEPACVNAFNRLIELTHCKVVISSSWRKTISVEALKTFFQEQGVVCEIVGTTEFLGDNVPRWKEIGLWIDTNMRKGDTWVVIDDDWNAHPDIWTDLGNGFMEEQIEMAVGGLKGRGSM